MSEYTAKYQVKVGGIIAEGVVRLFALNLEDACESAQEHLHSIFGSDFIKVLEVSA